MTIREAIVGEIEPYSLSDDSIEKAYVDAAGRFGGSASIDAPYAYAEKKTCNFAAMLCLNRVRVLASENIGGISNSYNVANIDKRIKALAREAGISADLVGADEGDATISFARIW